MPTCTGLEFQQLRWAYDLFGRGRSVHRDLRRVILLHRPREPKVCESHMRAIVHRIIEEKVLGLDVAVSMTLLVNFYYTFEELLCPPTEMRCWRRVTKDERITARQTRFPSLEI